MERHASRKSISRTIGTLGGKGDHVKTDISRGEKLEFDVEQRTMLNQYSDIEEEGDIIIQSYGLEEIVIEIMAALMGRTIPRDPIPAHLFSLYG